MTSSVIVPGGKAARSSQVSAVRSSAEANNDGDPPAKRAAAAANKKQGRKTGSTMFKFDDVRAGVWYSFGFGGDYWREWIG